MEQSTQTKLLTIFTPTYNRAHTLCRTYQSLQRQHCKNFLWLVIDDGSVDHTRELVLGWQRENDFEIQYIYQENGGMHTAHNTACEHIKTELNLCLDSDDLLADDAVGMICRAWERVKGCGYAGFMGLDADLSGRVIGKGFPAGMSETTVSGYYARGGAGDKKLVYRTDIIRRYPPYPVFKGEKYVALAYKYRLIDQDYQMAVLNEVLCYVDYQPDGSSRNMWKQYLENPRGFAAWRRLCMKYPVSARRWLLDGLHYCFSNLLVIVKE